MVLALSLLGVFLVVAAIWLACGPLRSPRWQTHPIARGHSAQPRIVLVTGATGFIGRHLCRHLIESGDHLIVLTRHRQRAWELFGPHASICASLHEIADSARIDCVINLAGEPIFARPWTAGRRRELIESRVGVTAALTELMARLERKPAVFISMSAVGYYGVRQDQELTEADRGQTIFQSQLCQLWELAAQKAENLGVRVCRLRLGMVLGTDGGALPRLIMAARFRVRTLLGSGRQWISWIHIEDVIRLIACCRDNERVRGAINATAPVPVTQREFAQALSGCIGGSLPLRMPAWVLRLGLGEMAQLLVDGQRVLPMKAQCAGFQFRHGDVRTAFADLLAARRQEPAEILYDMLCPICSGEMNHYARLASRQALPWKFLDVAVRAEFMAQRGLELADARKRVYVVTQSGAVVSGMDAFDLIWSGLPRWRVVAALARLPVIRPIAAAVYDLMLAPLIWRWNRGRRAAGLQCRIPQSRAGAADEPLAAGPRRRSDR